MKKTVTYLIRIFVLVFCLVFSVADVTYAYTEEEKQQAKAWLSAHGYSPDAGGASQAYQDYLNGKFDEELGYDTNGDGIPAATTEESSPHEETTEKEAEGISIKPENRTDSAETADKSGSNRLSSAEGAASNVKDDQPETEDIGRDEEESLEKQKTMEDNRQQSIEDITDSSVRDDSRKSNITWYQTENKSKYQNAGIIVVLSGLFILLWGAFFHS